MSTPAKTSPFGDRPIGLIGLGLIGSALASRLLTGGASVLGYDLDPTRGDELRKQGGAVAATAPDVFSGCDRLLLSLPTHREVEAVLGSAAGELRHRHLIIDTTTGDPQHSAAVARGLATRGIAYLDATISGNSAQLRQGMVTLMVGGEAGAFAAAQDIFARLGQQTFHTGPAGTGARMKLVTNLVLGLNRAALAESLVLAKALGLDPALALTVMKGSPAYSRMMDVKGEKMIRGEFSPDARLTQHLKDVRLILEAGENAGLPMPLSRTHRAILEAAEAAGWGELDNSALIQALEAGRTIGGKS